MDSPITALGGGQRSDGQSIYRLANDNVIGRPL